MAGFWGKRKREEQDAADADLARRAEMAIVAADERVRLTADELDFAVAELGEGQTADLRTALEAVRTHLAEAFHLHQLNHDHIPDTPEELRTRNARIIQLSEWAEDLLEERTTALQPVIEKVRRAPETLEKVRADQKLLAQRVPAAREAVARLATRYSPAALQQISGNPEEIEQLLTFAVHTADVSERRREAGQREQAGVALEAATESIRRAESLLEAIDSYEIEALRAESTLAAVVEDSRGDLVDARRGPQTPAVTQAMTALEKALAELPARGARDDPFGALSTLRQANSDLDVARERASRPVIPQTHVTHAVDDADRQLTVARSIISGHRGWIGADARTRFAEAERLRAEIPLGPVAEESRERTIAQARRVAALAAEALQLAQRDIDSSRPNDWGGDGWGGGRGGGRGGMGGGSPVGGILGGLVIGSLLGDMFDG
jgi:DNA repair exonuclease SbcCD ATPase subunit